MNNKDILSRLPYTAPFLFVDKLDYVDEHGAEGRYYLDPGLDFFTGHFKGHPVTPGVILTEIMAQIGLVCLGIYLMKDRPIQDAYAFLMTRADIEFLKPVGPGETVFARSERIYFRFGKLKCKVNLYNGQGVLVSSGIIDGLLMK